MPSRAIVLPVGLTPEEWAHQLRIDWSQDDVPEWGPMTDWKEWGRRLVNQNTALRGAAPFPDQFATFEEWAMRVFQTTN